MRGTNPFRDRQPRIGIFYEPNAASGGSLANAKGTSSQMTRELNEQTRSFVWSDLTAAARQHKWCHELMHDVFTRADRRFADVTSSIHCMFKDPEAWKHRCFAVFGSIFQSSAIVWASGGLRAALGTAMTTI